MTKHISEKKQKQSITQFIGHLEQNNHKLLYKAQVISW